MTDTPKPETDDFRPCHLTPSDWPAFARAMEIERDAARAVRDALRADRKKLLDMLNEAAASAGHDGYDESVELWRTVASHLDRFKDAAAAERDVLRAALELIACPMRPDGSYNRDRAACGTLAREAFNSLLQ